MKLNAWLAASFLATVAMAPSVQAAQLIENGGFETQGLDSYDIPGWLVAEQGVFGSVLSASGQVSEVTGNTTVGAQQGNYYGLLDNYGLSGNVLYQSFTTSAVSQATLTFQMFVNNQHTSTAFDASGLDYLVDASRHPNQHVRVDLLKAASDPFSTSSVDIVQTLYLGGANGNQAANNYINYQFDLSSTLASGGSYILRFATVANQNSLQLGVDNVSLQTVSAVPEADTTALMLCGLGLMALVIRRRYQ